MDNEQIKQKWDRIYSDETEQHWPPAEVLDHYQHLLPRQGTGLDLACGYGPNALFMAERGLTVYAWDISPVAVSGVQKAADTKRLTVYAEVKDIDGHALLADHFDVVVVAHYLDRTLMPYLRNSIKSGGLLFYQTFITEKIDESGPSSADFLLQPNELIALVPGFIIRAYREEGACGDTNRGFRNKAMLVAQKP